MVEVSQELFRTAEAEEELYVATHETDRREDVTDTATDSEPFHSSGPDGRRGLRLSVGHQNR